MTDFWDRCALREDPFPETINAIHPWIGDDAPAPAIAALDIAFHDRIGKKTGKAIYELYDLPAPHPMTTSYTISIDTPENMAQMALESIGTVDQD